MNTEKLEKLKKSLDNKFIPDNVKDKIRNEIENLESEIKSEDITATELKKEVAKVEEKVEVAVEKAEKKAESTEPKKGRGRPRKTPTTTPVEPKATETAIKKTAMVVAKTIRKDGEKWNDAMKRANGVMKKEKVEVKKTTKSELDRLLARVRKNKSLMSELKGVKDLRRDAMRTAKPVGKRMSESGNVYYEYRANKTDRKTYGKYAFKDGGRVESLTKELYRLQRELNSSRLQTYRLGDVSQEAMDRKNEREVKLARFNEVLKELRESDAKFELGGSVVTDLAGHTGGGTGGFNPRIPLDGFSNTSYTGLVGETGAMSSGEMFMSGGRLTTNRELLEAFLDSKKELKVGNFTTHYSTLGDVIILRNYGTIIATRQGKKVNINSKKYSNTTTTITNLLEKLANDKGMKVMKISDDKFMSGGSVGMANQQVIDDASQSYVNYYLGEGTAQGIYKDGGAIMNQYAGRKPEDIWNSLSVEQRKHFLKDHRIFVSLEEDKRASLYRYDELPKYLLIEIKEKLTEHVKEGQYAKGGSVTNERKHVNKGEDYEVRYSKPRPSRKGYLGKRDFSRGGLTGESARVDILKEEFASEDLIDELKEKLNLKSDDLKNQDVIAFAYTNYGGSIIDKYAIEYFLENYPRNIVVEETSYDGKNAFVFGKPAKEWMEQSDDYILGFDDFESFYYEKENEDFMEGINFFIQDLKRDYIFDEEEVRDSLEEKFTGYFNVDTSGLDYSEEQMVDYLKTEGLIKEEEFAKGGGVRKVGNREYSYGRNWTNDQRHVNQSEEHEVNYTRKGKFLGIFAKGGGIFADGRIVLRTFNGIGGNKNKTYSLIKDDRDSDGKPYFTLVEKPSGNIMAQGDDFEEVNNVANIFNGKFMDSIFAKGGGVRQVGNREYSTGRNWTNDHRHTNKSEEHEVNYNRKRFFAGGGSVNDDTPKIYVADLEAYNNGRLSGVWLDLTDYSDADELMDAINDFLKTTGGEEYAVHDYENLPSSMYSEYMGVRDFEEIYEMLDLAKENDLPLDVVMEIVSQFDRSAVEEYTGTYDSEQDFAEQLVDDFGGIQNFNDFQYYLEVSDTDRRLLSQDMADGYVDDIRDEDGGNRLIEEAGLDVDEYEEADSERQDEMLDEAREIVYDEYYNNYFEGLSDPYYFLVEEQGLYDAESFANAGFVRVDYEKLGDALEQDYTFVRHDGKIYVFNIR